jgi:large subunit ribosomal protein L6
MPLAKPMSAAKFCARSSERKNEESDMSRVGKKPVAIPAGVTAKVEGQSIAVKGAKGELAFVVPEDVSVTFADNQIKVDPRSETKRARAMWGMSRAMVNNLVIGVSKGFEKKLEITGVGYKAAVSGKNLQLSLGYSHDVQFPIPDGIAIVTPKPTEVAITGIDKRQVGQVAAEIRALRPPEPYKGKGVKYAGEFIFRKEGKKK